MEESLNSLIKTIDSQAQKDTKELIRTKIYEWIDEVRKNDKYSSRLEIEEIIFWSNVLCEYKKNDKYKLVDIYSCLNKLRYTNDDLKDLLNKE